MYFLEDIYLSEERQLKQSALQTSKVGFENTATCLICFDSPPNVIFLPCKHFAIDLKCFQKMKEKKKELNNTCVICRKEIERLVVIDVDGPAPPPNLVQPSAT